MTETNAVKISVVYVLNGIDWERGEYYQKVGIGSVFAIVGEYDEKEDGDPEQPNFGLKNDPRAICLLEFADQKVANEVASGLKELLHRLGHDVQMRCFAED